MAIVSLFLAGTIACGGNSANQEGENHNSEMHSDHDGHDMDHSTVSEADLLPIPDGAGVSFGEIKRTGTVIDPSTGEEQFTYNIKFQVKGMEVEPAGELHEGKGHHHLMINGGPIQRGTVVPADSVNIHYGKGQTETDLDLPRGEYKLTMQFADGYHQSYGEQLSATTTLVIE